MIHPGASPVWIRWVASLFALLVWQAQAEGAYLVSDPLQDFSGIDLTTTTAVVDLAARQIRLPTLPATVAFHPDSPGEYAVVRSGGVQVFHWDGVEMVPGVSLSSPAMSPLAVAFAGEGRIVTADEDRWLAYEWTGGGWTANPYVAVTGLTRIVSISAGVDDSVVVATHAGAIAWQVGAAPVLDEGRSVAGQQVLAAALRPGMPDLLVVTQTDAGRQVVYYNQASGTMVPNPYLTLTGLSDPRAASLAPDGSLLVLDGSQVHAVHWTGSALASVVLEDVTVENPTALAMAPGTGDLAIVDGGYLRYFERQPDGTYQRRSAREVRLDDIPGFSASAQVQSVPYVTESVTGVVRISATAITPQDTSVSWALSSNGGLNWTQATPGQWVAIPAGQKGSSVLWRAELASPRMMVTPVIRGPVRLEAGAPPKVEALRITPTKGRFVTSLTPVVSWEFSDPDPDDEQTARQILIRERTTGAIVYNSGKVSSLQWAEEPQDHRGPGLTVSSMGTVMSWDMPTGIMVGGTYQYRVEVRVWDTADIGSDWSGLDFDVLALGNLRVRDIRVPPPGQPSPPPDIATLPVFVRAGAQWSMAVDLVGPPGTTVTGVMTVGQSPAYGQPWSPDDAMAWTLVTQTEPTAAEGAVVSITIMAAEPDGEEVRFGPLHVATVKGSVLEDWVIVNVR